jgi:putative hydrolase of the HAD superfamily
VSIRVALLDLGNVLVRVDPRKFVVRAAEGSSRTVPEILERYEQGERKAGVQTGPLTETEFFSEMAEWLGRPDAQSELKQAWVSVFTSMPEAEAAFLALEQTCQVWIVSDTDALHLRYLREHYPFIRRAGRTFASFETGLRKTDERIFRQIIDQAGCDPQEIFFVDDLADHITRAKRVGMRGMVFTNWPEVLRKMNVSGR